MYNQHDLLQLELYKLTSLQFRKSELEKIIKFLLNLSMKSFWHYLNIPLAKKKIPQANFTKLHLH